MRFRSKIDWWAYLLFIGWTGANLWALISYLTSGGLSALIILISFTPFTVFFFIPMWFGTYYTLGDDGLAIRAGYGKGMKIAYESIISVSKTRNPISSPALSMDRLEVRYRYTSGSFTDSVIISPKDKDEFFRQLKEKNEAIVISAEKMPMSKGNKAVLWVALGISVVVLIGTGLMFISGEADPVVTVLDDGVQISGMYGIKIFYTDIAEVSLIDKSYREFSGGGGTRTNGYGGFGQTLKGHFSSPNLGIHMLFIRANTAPTIKIERRYSDIYINFRDSEKTEQLYLDITAALAG